MSSNIFVVVVCFCCYFIVIIEVVTLLVLLSGKVALVNDGVGRGGYNAVRDASVE